MKKLLSALICLGLVISMGAVIGCGEKKADPPKKEEPKKEEPKK